MDKKSRILIVGHKDVIERSLFGYFKSQGFENVFSSSEIALDTTVQASVQRFFSREKPEYVFLGSVLSGGIEANQNSPADFFYSNSTSQNNVVYAAYKFGIKKLIYFASSCIYPKECAQPMKEEYLMTGAMEQTSLSYSMAKLAGIELCRAYRKQYGLNAIVAVPATVYGPECDVDISTAHVLGALVQKFYKATKENVDAVEVWGSGNPRREFIFSEDFVSACIFLMDKYDESGIVHIGCGEDVAIKELAQMLKEISGFRGNLSFDATKPDGAMKKLLDNSRILKLGWKPAVDIQHGLDKTYNWYSGMMSKEKIS